MKVVNEFTRKIYISAKDIKFLLKGIKQRSYKLQMKSTIKNAILPSVAKKQLLYLLKYGSKYQEYVNLYVNTNVEVMNSSIEAYSPKNPTVICVVKNDLMRIELFLEYYRKMGFKQFAILDDNSTDGTREYLLSQPDVTVYVSNVSYSTVQRQVWINKMVLSLGYDRWYLIVDSDELFDYPNSKNVRINSYIQELERRNNTRVKALLLDMFSKNSLFAQNVKFSSDIENECSFFFPKYEIFISSYDFYLTGGARQFMFKEIGADEKPIVSKYPLIYMRDDDVLINSHYNIPAIRNTPIKASCVLKHYKFLPQDRKKYEDRVVRGNFYNGSIEYKTYFEIEKSDAYSKLLKYMIEYKDFSSIKDLDVIN